MTGRTYLLLPGPLSGSGRGAHVLTGVRDRLARSSAIARVVQGATAEETGALLRAALDAGRGEIAAVVALGGDGMVHLAVQALAGTDVPLGIVPAGTGNDSARAFGLPLKDLARATDVILAGRTRRVDLARSGDRWFLTILATGFDAIVAERGGVLAWPRNNLRYTAAVLLELPRFRPLRYTLVLDGVEQTRDAMFVSVANTDYFGGGMRIAAGSAPDDGLLDVCLVKPVSRLTLLRFFLTVGDGSHVDNPIFERIQVRSVTIAAAPAVTTYADGERFGEMPLTVEAVPGALSVVVP